MIIRHPSVQTLLDLTRPLDDNEKLAIRSIREKDIGAFRRERTLSTYEMALQLDRANKVIPLKYL